MRDRLASPRDQENELLLKHIKQIHRKSRETYGSPCVHAELTMGLGLPVKVKRVARLMRQAGVQGPVSAATARLHRVRPTRRKTR